MQATTRSLIRLTAVGAAVAASVISYHLVKKHVTGSSGQSWFDVGCSDSPEPGSANCAKVLSSPHAVWPAVKEGDPPDKLRIPVAFLGLVYYSMVGIWLIGVGIPSREKWGFHILPLAFTAAGVVFSLYYLVVMFTELDAWCPWCLVTHVLNFGLLISLVVLTPRKALDGAIAEARNSGSSVSSTGKNPLPPGRGSVAEPSIIKCPTWSQAWGTVGAIGLVLYGHVQFLRAGVSVKRVNEGADHLKVCVERLKDVTSDPIYLITKWETSPKRSIPILESDPIRHAAEGEQPIDLVIFSDFECPYCKSTAEFLESRVVPLFDGHIAMVFKHYPLDQTCNPHAQKTVHPRACEGAKLAEACRILGGGEAFWKAHDTLFAQQALLRQGQVTPEMIAKELGLDASALRETSESHEVSDRIRSDADLGKALQLGGTPRVYVGGRLVDTMGVREIKFWDEMANRYWRALQKPRPEHTKIPATTSTPGNPSPPSGP